MVDHILKHDGKALTGLFQNLKRLRELNHLFGTHVDKNLAEHCSVVNILNGSLVIIADNGNWATQLRFQIPDLLEKLRREPALCGLKNITCKTRPNFKLENPEKKRKKTQMKKLSQKIAHAILLTAETISDEKLKKILQRIAERSN